MRAQITGLETAQKNAKDGISLVQTAEGALTAPLFCLWDAWESRTGLRLSQAPQQYGKDFLPFGELPVCFFPYDGHNGYIPFFRSEERFGNFINFGNQVISRNFFKDLEKPVLALDVFSQYELEYLNDNVRKSEDTGRENHIYLHDSDWSVFCSYLQYLNLRKLLESRKIVFLIEDEAALYPIDFKERFGVDYSQYPVKPAGIREVTRMIWHTQLSTHNGGDFFNEVFDGHPNLIAMPYRRTQKRIILPSILSWPIC